MNGSSRIVRLTLLWLMVLSFVVVVVVAEEDDSGSLAEVAAALSSLNATVVDDSEQGSCDAAANDGTCTTTEKPPAASYIDDAPSPAMEEEGVEEERVLEWSEDTTTTAGGGDDDAEACVDLSEECAEWVEYGSCESHVDFMEENCRKSCQLCFDYSSLNWEAGEDLGVVQHLDEENEEMIRKFIEVAREYLFSTVYNDPKYHRVRRICRNQDASCAHWSVQGECQANPSYMNVTCAPMCQTCQYLDIRTRCPLDPNATNIWAPGDLNKMFERVTTQPEYQPYEPVVLSRPELAPYDTMENATYQIGPWVILLEKAITAEEADRLIELGAEEGYERSSDVGAIQSDGTYGHVVNDGRTSTNAWCAEKCYEDPISKAIIERIENITQIPDNNTEYLQLLRYDVGQLYQTHHDLIESELEDLDGVRILTYYMYLNDVEEGGGTNFPHLNLTVTPKKGRAVMWPSVLNDDPHKIDQRTEHQALPVEKGIKYGANAWFHQRDFKTPHADNCLA